MRTGAGLRLFKGDEAFMGSQCFEDSHVAFFVYPAFRFVIEAGLAGKLGGFGE